MTYVYARAFNDYSVIVADSLVTPPAGAPAEHVDRFTSKCGVLIPGVTFGASGQAGGIYDFVTAARARFPSTATKPDEFLAFCRQYPTTYRLDDGFDFVFSSRLDSHAVRLLEYRSDTGAVVERAGPVSLGSGKNILDQGLAELEAHPQISPLTLIQKMNARPRVIGYLYCLCLTSLTRGGFASRLEGIGVGGQFRFVAQTVDEDIRRGRYALFLYGTTPSGALAEVAAFAVAQFDDLSICRDSVLYGNDAFVVVNDSLADVLTRDKIDDAGRSIKAEPCDFFAALPNDMRMQHASYLMGACKIVDGEPLFDWGSDYLHPRLAQFLEFAVAGENENAAKVAEYIQASPLAPWVPK